MTDSVLAAIIAAASGFGGAILGTGATLWIDRARARQEQTKLLGELINTPELQKARIASYRELWQCLDSMSTHSPSTIVANLPAVQNRLHDWYYNKGGGLLLPGKAGRAGSTKDAFFVARDMQSTDATAIWQAFHNLRYALRSDLGIFEDADAEEKAIGQAKAKLLKLGS